ncbi:MAG TPA: hypothetical protein VLH60_03320 [Sedimentisphaerales bacterium]|nr:hypothetical protein [Sedimentisphaerales bacterium]
MNERPEIDELLNCYIDGELSERQATEVKRMMLHDRKIAERVAWLQRQRQLLRALPSEAAPADVAESVRSVLERRALLRAAATGGQHVKGSLHLMGRKLMAAAAMLALVGGLAVLVYTVVKPAETFEPAEVAVLAGRYEHDRQIAGDAQPVAMAQIVMELAMRTSSPGALNSVIARAIDSRGLWGCVTVDRQQPGTTYYITCGRADIAGIFDALSASWDRIEDKTLLIAAAGEEPIVITPIAAAQVVAIVNAPDMASRLAWARHYAQEGTALTPSATPADGTGEMRIPKPSLTSPGLDRAAMAEVEEQGEQVNLKILVVGLN